MRWLVAGASIVVGLARSVSAQPACDNAWTLTDLVGIAADGTYVTRTRDYRSRGPLDDDHVDDTIEIHAPDGTLTGAVSSCHPDAMGCPDDPDAAGTTAHTHWHASGNVPADLLVGAPTAGGIVADLAKRLALRPGTPAAISVRVSGAFVHAGSGVLAVLPTDAPTADGRDPPITWTARLLERSARSPLLLELATKNFYRVRGGTCGFETRTLEVVPRARVDGKDHAFAIRSCLANPTYAPVWSRLPPDEPLLPPRFECVLDLGDDAAIPMLAALRGDDIGDAPAAAAGVASRTSLRGLIALAGASDPDDQTFALRAFAQLGDWLRGQPLAQAQRRVAPLCLEAALRSSGEPQAAALACVDAAASALPTPALLDAWAAARDLALRAKLAGIAAARADLAKICARAVEGERDACAASGR